MLSSSVEMLIWLRDLLEEGVVGAKNFDESVDLLMRLLKRF